MVNPPNLFDGVKIKKIEYIFVHIASIRHYVKYTSRNVYYYYRKSLVYEKYKNHKNDMM